MNSSVLGSPVLVTGATGFAGSYLVQSLAGSCDLVGWGRSAPHPDFARLASWQSINLLDRQRVRSAISALRPSVIYHLAGAPQVAESFTDTARPLEGNVLAAAHLLDAVRRAGLACRVLVVGSAAVYAPSQTPLTESDPLSPSNPYALSKLAEEELARRAWTEDGINLVIVRPFNHTGPRQSPAFVAPSLARQISLIESGAAEPVIRVGNLDTERDFSDVRDVVRAYIALMEQGQTGAIYNVGSGVGRSIRSVLDALIARARVEVRVVTDPARLRPTDVPSLVADATRLRKETGWAPRIPFTQTLDDLLDYWRSLC